MSERIEGTFSSIESAHEFVCLLALSIAQAEREIEDDLKREQNRPVSRRLDALRLTHYTLKKLDLHVTRSRRALNDLRSLRRLLLDERATFQPLDDATSTSFDDRPTHAKGAKRLAQNGALPAIQNLATFEFRDQPNVVHERTHSL